MLACAVVLVSAVAAWAATALQASLDFQPLLNALVALIIAATPIMLAYLTYKLKQLQAQHAAHAAASADTIDALRAQVASLAAIVTTRQQK